MPEAKMKAKQELERKIELHEQAIALYNDDIAHLVSLVEIEKEAISDLKVQLRAAA